MKEDFKTWALKQFKKRSERVTLEKVPPSTAVDTRDLEERELGICDDNGSKKLIFRIDNVFYTLGFAAGTQSTIPSIGGAIPSLHASDHEDGGSDEISIEGLSGIPTEMYNMSIAMSVALGMP